MVGEETCAMTRTAAGAMYLRTFDQVLNLWLREALRPRQQTEVRQLAGGGARVRGVFFSVEVVYDSDN
jgi:hypothetical protein